MKTLLLVTTGLLSANVFAADTLTVYTYSSFTAEWGPGPKIKQAFEKACDCTLNLVPLEDGVAILNRLRLEGNHSKADLVLGLDDALISEAKQSGLFAPTPPSWMASRCRVAGRMTPSSPTTTATSPSFMTRTNSSNHPRA